jgi:uncharacterized membrane protein YdjX (TVP38/TMEM64 family)
MKRLWLFLTEMDSRAWRAALVTGGLLATIGAVFLFGKTQLGADLEGLLEQWLGRLAGSPWGLPATVAVFTGAAFVGAPQFLLIAVCVIAFGPWLGFLYSWIATIASAAVTFGLGRLAGRGALERFGGRRLDRLSRFVGRNAFIGSFIIRNVPSAPFIVVNMAFGVSRARFWSFLAGCALGVLPKTAVVALFGTSILTATVGDGIWSSAIIGAIALAWLGMMLYARGLLQRRADREE